MGHNWHLQFVLKNWEKAAISSYSVFAMEIRLTSFMQCLLFSYMLFDTLNKIISTYLFHGSMLNYIYNI